MIMDDHMPASSTPIFDALLAAANARGGDASALEPIRINYTPDIKLTGRPIQSGDVVRLKSGGPMMTCLGECDNTDGKLRCMYVEDCYATKWKCPDLAPDCLNLLTPIPSVSARLKVGDVVYLRSGSVSFTINSIDENSLCSCVRFDKRNGHTEPVKIVGVPMECWTTEAIEEDSIAKATDRSKLLGAIARGWTAPKNENKVMDADLANAIADEIEKIRG